MSASKKGTVAANAATTAARKTAKRIAAEKLAAQSPEQTAIAASLAAMTNPENGKLLTAFSSADEDRLTKRGFAIDALYAAGTEWKFLISPQTYEKLGLEVAPLHREVYAFVVANVKAGIKAFKDDTDLSRKTGSKVSDLKDALKARYETAARGPSGQRDPFEAVMLKTCKKWLERVEKAESFKGNKDSAIAALKTLAKSIKL